MGLGAYVCEGLCVLGGHLEVHYYPGRAQVFVTLLPNSKVERACDPPFSARVCARAHVVSVLLVTTRL